MPERTYGHLVRRWGAVLVIATFLGGAAAFAASGMLTPRYEATTTLLVEQRPPPGVPLARADVETSMRLAGIYSEILVTQPVLDRAVRAETLSLSSSEIRERLEVEQIPLNPLIRVTASSSTAAGAQAIANTVAEAFVAEMAARSASAQVQVTTIEPAGTPTAPVSPRRTINTAGGALAGFLACAGLIALFMRLDDRVSRPAQVTAMTGLVTLGELHRFRHGDIPEEFRALRARIAGSLRPDSTGGFDRRVILFTGPRAREGTSVTAVNTAIVFGLAGYRVLLVDANLRHPAISETLAVADGEGLIDVLAAGQSMPATAVIQETRHQGVSVLAAGRARKHAADLVGSPEMRAMIGVLRERYDLLIMDAPPVLEVADAAVLATLTDVTVLVARAGKTRGRDLRDATDELVRAGRPIAGVVLDHGARGSRRFRLRPFVASEPAPDGAVPDRDVRTAATLPSAQPPSGGGPDGVLLQRDAKRETRMDDGEAPVVRFTRRPNRPRART